MTILALFILAAGLQPGDVAQPPRRDTSAKPSRKAIVPKADPATLILDADLPAEAREPKVPWRIEFRLTVDRNGIPTDCRIERSSDRPVVDETVCRLLVMRERFWPARDEAGSAIGGLYPGVIERYPHGSFASLHAQLQVRAQILAYSANKATPRGDPRQWITYADVPKDAAPLGKSGWYGLIVNSNGVPTSCEIIGPGAGAPLDAKGCQLLMARARFLPAHDPQGKPIESRYAHLVNWNDPAGNRFPPPAPVVAQPAPYPLPKPPNLSRAARLLTPLSQILSIDDYPPEARARRIEGTVAVTLIVGEQGIPVRCDIRGGSGFTLLDQTTCTLLMSRMRFEPAQGPDGRPIQSTFQHAIRWTLPD